MLWPPLALSSSCAWQTRLEGQRATVGLWLRKGCWKTPAKGFPESSPGPVLFLLQIMWWWNCLANHLTYFSLFHRPVEHRRGLSEYFDSCLLLSLWIKGIREYATYANLLSKLLLSSEYIRDHKTQLCIIMNCTPFARNMCSLLTEIYALHHFTGVRPLKVLSLQVKKFKYFIVSSARGVGRHHTVFKPFFLRYPGKKEPLCGIYGILNDCYNVGLSTVKKFPDFILCA